ncbi:hypothetical protein KDW_49960 [Dictyobacter vulcani]|uniref:Uncharacterized protein n=1 Tax=Dictyobacter vulcani TaxID=2607529 RepID=A0A5J4KNC5_9CHLR|nr:hypothetical protein KDW_49960 [Dictyobacter vulcani]
MISLQLNYAMAFSSPKSIPDFYEIRNKGARLAGFFSTQGPLKRGDRENMLDVLMGQYKHAIMDIHV